MAYKSEFIATENGFSVENAKVKTTLYNQSGQKVGTQIGATITASTGAGAVALTGTTHEVTTTGIGDALTLANGTAGQRLAVIYVAEGAGTDTAILTPTTLAGGTTITFNSLGDSAELLYSATGGWYVLGGAAVVA